MSSQGNMRAASAAAVAAVIVAASPTVHALCPNCLGQATTVSPTMKIVGVFLLVPPAIFFFVARLIRRLSR